MFGASIYFEEEFFFPHLLKRNVRIHLAREEHIKNKEDRAELEAKKYLIKWSSHYLWIQTRNTTYNILQHVTIPNN